MKKAPFALLLFLLQLSSHAQPDKNSTAIYKSIPEIEVVTIDSIQDKIGLYQWRVGNCVELLTLDSNMHFKERQQCCIGGEVLDSGVWFVYKTGRVGLKGKWGLHTFDLVKFSHFYFCIPPDQRVNFVTAFAKYKPDYPGSDRLANRLMYECYFHDLENPVSTYYNR